MHIEMMAADGMSVPANKVIPGFIAFSGVSSRRYVMPVVVEDVGLDQHISAVNISAIPFTAGLVVVQVIVVDVRAGAVHGGYAGPSPSAYLTVIHFEPGLIAYND